MNYRSTFTRFLLAGVCAVYASAAVGAHSFNGEAGFKEHCASCHAGGGNIFNPAKTLSKSDREKNGILTAEDILRIMRKPGEDMTVFDEKTLPDVEAKSIAEFILTTFR